MADPGDTATPAAVVSSPWDDVPDDFFLSASISPPTPPPAPDPIPSTSPPHPSAFRSASLPVTSIPAASASASFSDSLHRAVAPQPIHPSHSLPAFSAASRPAAADVCPPPPGPHHSNSLSEFAASASQSRVHRPPPRAAVRADRPPPLELRPRPPRESQSGIALSALACCAAPGAGTSTHLWAAGEAGVRVWDLADAFRSPTSPRRWGDEASAPFRESRKTPPALCLVVDPGRGLVWSGHTNGRIMCWGADPSPEAGECIGWDAHPGPVFAMVISPYGDLWSGSEGGIIKVWNGEAIEKSLALEREEKCKASLVVERSFIDLWTMVSEGGACPLPTVDVKLLLSDNSRLKIWSAGYLSFALWDSRTKELLKVVNVDGQVDTRFDVLSAQVPYGCETKQNLFSSPKKEKARSPVNFFQRSRNALMGAADAVRRVAAKAGFGDDTRRIEALVMSMDGMIWTGSANGSVAQWDGSGNRLQEFQHHSSSVQSIFSFGTRLWVGYMDGNIQLLDLDGNLLGGWIAHSSPILSMAVGSSYIFTLAGHGGVRGWNLSSPGPADSILCSELTEKETSYKNIEYMKVLVCSWNVGQEKASYESLRAWLKFPTQEVGVVVVGLQEVEMGAGFLAMSAAKETVGLEGSPNGEWWLDAIGQILKGHSFQRVGSRQMAGLLTAVWVRTKLKHFVGDIDNAAVACGLGRAIGNKGAVGLRMRIHDRSICFINCHFAAHMEAVSRRNEDFDHVFRTMTFATPSSGLLTTSISGSASQLLQANGSRMPELSDTDMIVFLGDFNYRLYDISYEEAMGLVSRRRFDWLRKNDQLRAEMRSGRVFQGLREGDFQFPPTYKFEKHKAGLSGYDCSEKKRIPAWCDRVLYRDSRASSGTECSLDCPVVCSVSLYDSCMEATDSDHKPVKCLFNLDVARIDKHTMRQKYGEIMSSNKKVLHFLQGLRAFPEANVSTNDIILQDQTPYVLKLQNRSPEDRACFEITGQAPSSSGTDSAGFPTWLKVSPAAGIICPGQTVEVTLQHGDPRGTSWNNLSGANQEKAAQLSVKVTGECSTVAKCYGVRVQCQKGRSTFPFKK
ncbi:type II inositol polyphosphate 5-phosphatase 15-like [Hordeum vulgare subsp. vulgare]|uniref:Inositol polyphosphate-related phosphatase domain-containing protein n=1 Tax=Hordeum vulgare subsp. vulgare TaxID=112509 RepID=A0A8I6YI42_HORVV|nr:type II inositol polyphosphate 5-phosphatase 15-like [Hordeum vulgare subsp. vulgare]